MDLFFVLHTEYTTIIDVSIGHLNWKLFFIQFRKAIVVRDRLDLFLFKLDNLERNQKEKLC